MPLKKKKISGYKSDNAHFILHYLLQVVVRRTTPKYIGVALIRWGAFFKSLCAKIIQLEDVKHLQTEIVEILCQLERIFLLSFFDIMVYLLIHLADEVKLGGSI